MFKKICAMLIATTLLVTSMVGCGNNKPKETDLQADEDKENFKVIWAGTPNMLVEKGTPVQKHLEERFNITIEPISYSSNYIDKIGAMIASNETPDVMFMPEPENWQPLAKQGVLADISIDTIKKYAPNYYKMVNDKDPAIWAIAEFQGKIWALPNTTIDEFNTACIWRKDWLDKLGIQKTPQSLQEFEEAYTNIRYNDPDGDGKKDTYGLTGDGGHAPRQFDSIFGAFGVMPGQWQIVDNNVVMGTVMPQAKEALTLLHDWYKKELIDPEFVTDSPGSAGSKFSNGRLGCSFVSAANFIESTATGKQTIQNIMKRDPNFQYVIGSNPIGKDGKHGDWMWGPRANFAVFSAKFGKSPNKVARVLGMMDAMVSDEQLALRVTWGEKGKTYDYNDPQAGASKGLKYLPPYDTNSSQRAQEGIGQRGFYNILQPYGGWATNEIYEKYVPQDFKDINNEYCNAGQYTDALMRPYLPSAPLYKDSLDRLKVVNYSKFIIGERPLSEWDQFVKEYNERGGSTLQKEAQKFYDETLKTYKK